MAYCVWDDSGLGLTSFKLLQFRDEAFYKEGQDIILGHLALYRFDTLEALASQQAQPWVALGITDVITGGQWHTFTLKGQIHKNLVIYQQFCLNQQCHPLDAIVPPALTPGEPDRLAVAFQLDGNFQGDSYDVFVDQVSLQAEYIPAWYSLFLPFIINE